MRFVTIKTVEQQDLQATHRVRSQLVSQRTEKVNQIRGLLAEYGLVVGQRIDTLRKVAKPERAEVPKSTLTR